MIIIGLQGFPVLVVNELQCYDSSPSSAIFQLTHALNQRDFKSPIIVAGRPGWPSNTEVLEYRHDTTSSWGIIMKIFLLPLIKDQKASIGSQLIFLEKASVLYCTCMQRTFYS